MIAGPASVSRRGLLTGAVGLAGLGVGGGVGAGAISAAQDPPATAEFGGETIEFYGEHQAGILTPAQAHANFVGVDLVNEVDVDVLEGLLQAWTQDGARLVAGSPGLADIEPELAARPSRLTITVGLGPGVFAAPELVGKRPSWLAPLPAFSIDRLQPRWAQTDLILQIGSDDPVALSHATRVLTAGARSQIKVRWVQQGFTHARNSVDGSTTMRNLFGQVDGTVTLPEDRRESLLWNDGGEQPWIRGGTSLVLRRISMNLDTWEALDRRGRELSLGRALDTGAPLTGTKEHDEADFAASKNGITVIPESAHIARAHHRNDTEQFLRRGFNYDDLATASDSGLIFAAYQRDPVKQFVPVQRRLAEFDALNEWTTPIGSAVYAILPGATVDRPLGAALFGH